MRTKHAIYNVIFTWLGQFLLIIVTLVSRRIFLNLLGAEYLGVNSLFANVLSFLSMAELGIGSAITYSLYKPIAENDIEKIKSLMQLYKRAYWLIGFFILVVGLLLVPALPAIVTGAEGIDHLNIIYFLFLINTSISYFFSYKSAYIIADQKKYIFNINHYLWQLVLYVIQILTLLIYKNYYVYLGIQVVATVFENVTIARIVDKRYPFLKSKNIVPLQNETISEIKKNTFSMILNKVGSTLVNSTDNILISSFVSLSAVGIYGNYSTINAAIASVLYQGMFAVVASVGNLSILGSEKRKSEVFELLYLVIIWLYGWACIGEFVLLTPFVQLWYGSSSILSVAIVAVIVLNLFIAGQAVLLNIHIDAMGLYWHVRFQGIIEATINLAASIYLGKKFGLIGVLIGTTLSNVLFSFWNRSFTVFRYGFNSSVWKYYRNLLKDVLIVIIALGLTTWLANMILLNGALSFIAKFVIATIVPNTVFYFCFRKRAAFKELLSIIQNVYFSIIKHQ